MTGFESLFADRKVEDEKLDNAASLITRTMRAHLAHSRNKRFEMTKNETYINGITKIQSYMRKIIAVKRVRSMRMTKERRRVASSVVERFFRFVLYKLRVRLNRQELRVRRRQVEYSLAGAVNIIMCTCHCRTSSCSN